MGGIDKALELCLGPEMRINSGEIGDPIAVVSGALIARGLRNAGGGGGMLGNFGKSRHRTLSKEMTGITFADVAGIEEAKEEVTEIVEFLKNPKKFTKLGGRIPRGVLLVGDPGVG